MKRAQKICYVLGVAVATVAAGGLAAAQQPPSQSPSQPSQPSQSPSQPSQPSESPSQPTEVMAQKMSATATVEKVDAKKRELTLKDAEGTELMVHVPADVTRLDAIKKGDQISVDYYQSVALSLKKKGGAGAQPGAKETTAIERKAGKLPGGMVARKITGTVEVMNVDTANNRVTVKGPRGQIETINVSDPDMQAELSRIKKGDHIQATYTEAVAISVTPQEKKKAS
jgi:Cu/Ag efflux protein CusF